jgi:hypothetical protein
MSEASEDFSQSIKDAENLLMHFDSLNTKPPPPEIEVLKRAGLIMAMTAWETYVEDLLQEASEQRLAALRNREIAEFVRSKLNEEINRLHNPGYQKTITLFRDYAGIDLTSYWSWNNCEIKTVKQKLGQYMKLRGDIVHRSRVVDPDSPNAHPVKKVDLEKAIAFLKNLVEATERAFTRVEQSTERKAG